MTAEAKTETSSHALLRGIADSTAKRAHVRMTGAEYAQNMAAAHFNGAMLGMLALIRHAEQATTTEPTP